MSQHIPVQKQERHFTYPAHTVTPEVPSLALAVYGRAVIKGRLGTPVHIGVFKLPLGNPINSLNKWNNRVLTIATVYAKWT